MFTREKHNESNAARTAKQNTKRPMKNTITITQQDLSTEEKTEAFCKLFSRSTFAKVMNDMAVQVHGDGKLEQLQNKVGVLDLQKGGEDEELYEKLRLRMEKESARLTPVSNAIYEMEVTESLADKLLEKSDLAKEVLGTRYWQAVFPLGSTADFATLRKFNADVQEADGAPKVNNAIGDLQNKIEDVRRAERRRIVNM